MRIGRAVSVFLVALLVAFFIVFTVCILAVRVLVIGLACYFGITFFFFLARCRFRRTFRHDFHFFTSSSQCILSRTNHFLLAFPIGHFQSFLESLDGGWIFGAVG